MPNIEVRALDLSKPDAPIAFPFPNGSEPIALNELNYVWVRARSIQYGPGRAKIVRMRLRFRVEAGQFVLCDPLPRIVREMDSDLKRALTDVSSSIVWRATMIHNPDGIGRITSSVLSVDDSVEVGVFELGSEWQSTPRVVVGTIARIFPLRT
jgi:hypothetical protein